MYDNIFEHSVGGVAHLGERLNGIQEVRGSTPLISTINGLSSPFLFFEGHNYVVCNCVAVKPLRAGAHSHVQAHSFHYYGTLCLRPPPHLHQHLGKSNTYCVRFFFYLLMRGYTTMLHFLPITL